MTEGPTPREPRDEPGAPDEAPRWESPGAAPPPPPSQGETWGQQPGSAPPPPPPPPPSGGQGWEQPGGYSGQPGGYSGQPGGYSGEPGGYSGQPASSGMAPNVASGLSYVLTWLTGLIFFLVDKRPEVRFHAMQAIAYGVLWTLVAVVRPYMPGPIGALFGLVLLAFFIGWIVLMIQGFQGKHFKLPVIGDFAEQQAGRPGL